jgi:hypothetical protein
VANRGGRVLVEALVRPVVIEMAHVLVEDRNLAVDTARACRSW